MNNFSELELLVIQNMAFSQIRKVINQDIPFWQPPGNDKTEDLICKNKLQELEEYLVVLRSLYAKVHPEHKECALKV